MTFSGVVQFILGIVLGIAILGMTGLAAGSYFFNQLSKNPTRPIFPEEKPNSTQASSPVGSGEAAPDTDAAAPTVAKSDSTTSAASATEPLEPGAYRARVTWPDGLSLRDEPSLDANRLETIVYNQEMIVLRSTDDSVWDRVRIPDSNQEGWVKAGNAERIEED
ncbi:MAG: SH3 domain-containing protein [Cyanobacteria bacterium P01_G01_bin.54]